MEIEARDEDVRELNEATEANLRSTRSTGSSTSLLGYNEAIARKRDEYEKLLRNSALESDLFNRKQARVAELDKVLSERRAKVDELKKAARNLSKESRSQKERGSQPSTSRKVQMNTGRDASRDRRTTEKKEKEVKDTSQDGTKATTESIVVKTRSPEHKRVEEPKSHPTSMGKQEQRKDYLTKPPMSNADHHEKAHAVTVAMSMDNAKKHGTFVQAELPRHRFYQHQEVRIFGYDLRGNKWIHPLGRKGIVVSVKRDEDSNAVYDIRDCDFEQIYRNMPEEFLCDPKDYYEFLMDKKNKQKQCFEFFIGERVGHRHVSGDYIIDGYIQASLPHEFGMFYWIKRREIVGGKEQESERMVTMAGSLYRKDPESETSIKAAAKFLEFGRDDFTKPNRKFVGQQAKSDRQEDKWALHKTDFKGWEQRKESVFLRIGRGSGRPAGRSTGEGTGSVSSSAYNDEEMDQDIQPSTSFQKPFKRRQGKEVREKKKEIRRKLEVASKARAKNEKIAKATSTGDRRMINDTTIVIQKKDLHKTPDFSKIRSTLLQNRRSNKDSDRGEEVREQHLASSGDLFDVNRHADRVPLVEPKSGDPELEDDYDEVEIPAEDADKSGKEGEPMDYE